MTDLERTFVEAGRQARDADVVLARQDAHGGSGGCSPSSPRRSSSPSSPVRSPSSSVATPTQARARGQTTPPRVAEQQRAAADDAAESAQVSARDARIEALVGRAESLRSTQRDAAALLAVEAYRLADTPRTRSSLFATFTDDERFLDAHRFDGERGSAGIVLPDGETAYLTDADGRLRPYDLDTGTVGDPLPALGGGADRYPVLAASPDGRLARAGGEIRRQRRPDHRRRPRHHQPDAALRADHRGRRRDVGGVPPRPRPSRPDDRRGGPPARRRPRRRRRSSRRSPVCPCRRTTSSGRSNRKPAPTDGSCAVRPASPSPGSTLLVGTPDGSLRLFDASTIELQRTITTAANTLGNLRPLADGTVVTSGRFGLGRIDLTTGEAKWQVIEQETCVNVAVAEQRGLFYCGDPYGRLHEHDLESGALLRTLDAQNGNSGSLWTAGDGTELVSFGTFEPVVARWRLDGSGPITRVVAPGVGADRVQPRQ